MKRIALLSLFVLLSLAAGALGAQDAPTATPVPIAEPAVSTRAPAEILARAEEVAANANAAIATVGTMLGFLQVVGILLTILLAAAAILGIRNVQAARDDLQKELDNARVEFSKMEAEARNKVNSTMESILQADLQIQKTSDELMLRLRKAERHEERSINALSLVQLGKLQVDIGNRDAAVRTFEAARESDPSNRLANYYLGELYIIRRELDLGIERLREAQPDDVAFPAAEAALAYGLRLKGDLTADFNIRNGYYAEAERYFNAALQNDPGARDINNASIWAGLGALYRRQSRFDDAIRCYTTALDYTPDDSYPLVNLAMLQLQKGRPNDLSDAKQYFARVVDIAERRLFTHPSDQWARFDAITGRLGSGDVLGAAQKLDELLKEKPASGPMESFLGGLRFMAETASAPTAVKDFIKRVEDVMAAQQVQP